LKGPAHAQGTKGPGDRTEGPGYRNCSAIRPSLGEKQAWLLGKALDCKRDILTLPMPDPDDDSAEAIRMRALVLAAADSTIEQTIRLETNHLTPAVNDDGIEKLIGELRRLNPTA
jgi:hypothetical protein